MIRVKMCFFLALLLAVLYYPSLPLYGADHQGHESKGAKDADTSQKPVFSPMPDPGKKVPIGTGYYLVYGFDKRPKLGTIIMKVQVFSAEGKQDTSMEIRADSGMPSMSGAHETGDKLFKLSKKGDYLLPIDIVMPGDWEIRLTITKDGKVVFRGRYNFDV